jgi:hypothetical protein
MKRMIPEGDEGADIINLFYNECFFLMLKRKHNFIFISF